MPAMWCELTTMEVCKRTHSSEPRTAYTFFNAPGFPFPIGGINSSDQVVGSADGRGYIRNADGTFTFFDVPSQQCNCCFESAMGINDAVVVVGTVDELGRLHDFIRIADGSQYVLLDPTGVANPALVGINNKGELVGTGYGVSGGHTPPRLPPHSARLPKGCFLQTWLQRFGTVPRTPLTPH
jgi:hypothetical protein